MNTKPTPSSRRTDWLWVVVIALAARVGYCIWTGPVTGHREYIIAATRLVEYKSLRSPLMVDAESAEVSGLLPPLYACWVAAIYGLLGAESCAANIVLKMFNALAGAFACGLTFKVAESLWSRRAGWLAGLIAALNPALIGFTNYIWDTCFFTLGVVLCVWVCILLRTGPVRNSRFFWLGCLLGVVALVNPALTVTYPLLVLFPLWRRGASARTIWKPVLVAISGWLLVVTPWTIRHWVQLGSLSYVRTGLMLEVWLGATPEADAVGGDVYRNHFPLLNPGAARRVTEIGEKAYLKECGEMARRAIAADPARFAKLTFMRTIDHWLGTTLTHANTLQTVVPASRQRQLIMLVLAGEAFIVAAGFASGRLRTPQCWWLLSILVLFSLVYLVTHVQVRFRVPVEPLIAVLVAAALTQKRFVAAEQVES